MPPELQSMIASKLDAISYYSLKLVCKGLDTWVKDPPKLSASEWQKCHSLIEGYPRRRRKLQTLGCSGCKKILDRELFSDAAARNTLMKGRLCISCAIKDGCHDKRNFKTNGREAFGCRGCQKAMPLDEEDTCMVNKAHWYEPFPEVDTGSFIASRDTRWCHNCWAIVQNYRSLDVSPL